MGLMDILKQYAEPSTGHAATSVAHFDEVAQSASPQAVGNGVAAAFHSDQTPPFGDMVGKLFANSNGQQRAGVLNELLASISPSALPGLAGGALAGTRSAQSTSGSTPTVTAGQASQLTPEQVQEIAAHAHQQDPSIVDRVGSFYGKHPQLVKSLGAMALAVVLGKMAR